MSQPGMFADVGWYLGGIESLITWLVSYPVLPLTLLFLYAVAYNLVAGGMGLVHLFWDESRWKQVLTGVFTAGLVGEVLYVRYLLGDEIDPDKSWLFRLPPVVRWWESHPLNANVLFAELVRYLWLWPVLLLGFVPPAIFRGWRPSWWRIKSRWPLLLGLVIGWAIGLGGFAVVTSEPFAWLVNGIAGGLRHLNLWSAHPTELHAVWVVGLAAFMVALAFLAGTYIYGGQRHADIQPPAVTVITLLAVTLAVYGFVAQYHLGLQYLMFAAVAIVAWWTNRRLYKLRLPGLEDRYDDLPPEPADRDENKPAFAGLAGHAARIDGQNPPWPTTPPVVTPPTLIDSDEILQAARANWTGAGKPLLVFVATAGGGVRSSVFTIAALEELERHRPDLFPGRIRLITGASGGMVGAAYYVAERFMPDQAAPRPKPPARRFPNNLPPDDCPLAQLMAQDSLTPALVSLVYHDLPGLLMRDPWAWRLIGDSWLRRWAREQDRGRALEDAWAYNTAPPGGLSPFARPLSDLAPLEREARAPSLIFSPMMIEDARRLLISNLDLGRMCANGPIAHPYSVSSVEMFKEFPDKVYEEFRLNTAARINAAFPFLSPATFVPLTPPRRAVDAGYYDNYGLDVACEWLRAYREKIEKTFRVLVIQVRGYANEASRTRRRPTPTGGPLRFLTGPPLGLLNMRERSPWFRNDQDLAGVAAVLGDDFRTVILECDGDAPLGWTLGGRQTEEIITQARTGTKMVVDALAGWL